MRQTEDLKILIAEDNQINQRLAILTFKQLGLLCDIASNGKIAFEMHQQKHYDLILMDMHMPVLGGLESTELIRAYEKESGNGHSAFIVALTGSELNERRRDCISAGMNDFMEKPLRTDWLRTLIARISM
ncbi:MAG: response regulator [Prolixibacteraceae bacterium]|jgi:CheY-like chemotaxis protein